MAGTPKPAMALASLSALFPLALGPGEAFELLRYELIAIQSLAEHITHLASC